MNHIFRLCLPLALGAMALGQISTASAADNKLKGGGARAVPRAAAPAHIAAPRIAAVPRVAAPRIAAPRIAAPRIATPRVSAVPHIAARHVAAPARVAARPNLTASRTATVNRPFTRGVSTRTLRPNRTAGLSQKRPTPTSNALRAGTFNRNAGTNRLNRGNLAGRLNQPALGSRRLGRLSTNTNRFNAVRAGAATTNRGLVNAANPRRNISSNQFAFRSANFQPGWDPGRSYYWQGRHWRCFNGIWAVADIGLPYDWYAYPYPVCYDGLVYYGGDVYQPGGVAVSSNMVADIQDTLANDGYNPGPSDGIDGPQTQNAIAQYQSDNGMQPTGMITEPLLESMGLA